MSDVATARHAARTPNATITVFRDRPGSLLFYLVIGSLVMLQGAATAVYFLYFGEAERGFFLIIMGLSAGLFAIGLWFAGYAWRRMRDPDNPIVIGPAGLHDRAVSERPIPWRDIRNLALRDVGRGGEIIAFDLDEGAAERAGVRPRVKAAASVNRLFGYSYRIHHMGTEANVERLAAAIAPYAKVANTEGGEEA